MAQTVRSKLIAYLTTLSAFNLRPATPRSAPDWRRLLQGVAPDAVVPAVWPPERDIVACDLSEPMPFGDPAE